MTELQKQINLTHPVFSKYIRLRDTDEYYTGKCCTCGKKVTYHTGQCGHYINRRFLTTTFMSENAHLQCKECNEFNDGEKDKHAEFIDNTYGRGTAETLQIISRGNIKFTPVEIKEIRKFLKSKIKELKTNKY